MEGGDRERLVEFERSDQRLCKVGAGKACATVESLDKENVLPPSLVPIRSYDQYCS